MIDFNLLNSWLMAIVVVALMIGLLALRRHIGASWIVVLFEMLLFTIFLRRLDDILHQAEIHLLDGLLNVLLSWLSIVILTIGIVQMWRRRVDLQRSEARRQAEREQLRERERDLEELRQSAEHGMPWDSRQPASKV